MIDPFHLEKYGVTTVNYNRDVEIFPVLRAMLEKIQGASPYFSPTDMGVNMAGYCIVDDDAVREAANREILRRYYQTAVTMAPDNPEYQRALDILEGRGAAYRPDGYGSVTTGTCGNSDCLRLCGATLCCNALGVPVCFC